MKSPAIRAFLVAFTLALSAPLSALAASYLKTGDMLPASHYIVADNNAFFLILRADGSMCVYKGSGLNDIVGELWCSAALGPVGDYFAIQQSDGNFCVYHAPPPTTTGQRWCMGGGFGRAGSFTKLKNDGNLCILLGTPDDIRAELWCYGRTAAVTWSPPSAAAAAVRPFGTAKVVRAVIPGNDPVFPLLQPCPNDSYVVPAGVTFVKITAAGGAGVGYAKNIMATIGAIPGYTAGKGLGAPPGMTSWAAIAGPDGGRGANVTATFPVTAGQTLYIVAGMSGYIGMMSGRGVYSSGYPGGGFGLRPGGGYSMVSTARPARVSNPYVCSVDKSAILVIAGGGGGAGLTAGAGYPGAGGDAGMVNAAAIAGGAGSGALSGGGGGGGTQTGGGSVGSHPGCGAETRSAGGYLAGSVNNGSGGAGGGGLYGGGGGGGGDCNLKSGPGGGGGGSSYVSPSGMSVNSSVDVAFDAKVEIQAMK